MDKEIILDEFYSIKEKAIIKRTNKEIDELVSRLMSKMTLKEKIGQMYQAAHYGAELVGPSIDSSDTADLIKSGRVGSVLSVSDTKIIFRLQKYAVEDSRLGIPLLFAYDVVHGYKTIFPINLALACSWNEKLIEETSRIAAIEAGRSGIHMTFAPMLDVVRDPRWGRVMESHGEDSYLGSRYAKAYVKGFQQDDLTSRDSLAACAKHFIGYGLSEAGRDYNTVELTESSLRQHYLPPFESAIEAGVTSVMTSFNTVDGVPVTGNKKLVRELLKNELKFKGMVISDYDSSCEMIYHKTARDKKDVAERTLLAGLDMEMVSKAYIDHLEDLVSNKPEYMDYINDSVKRVLSLKYKLGLFDDPFKGLYDNIDDIYLTDRNRKVALNASRKSIVLLENDGILPISTNKKYALIGPLSKTKEVNGFWSAIGDHKDTVSLEEGFKSRGIDFKVRQGCDINSNDASSFNDVINIAKNCDVIVVAIGEDESMSGEGSSRAYLDIPGKQRQLFDRLCELNKPIITIIFSGRPLELLHYKNNSNALIQAWFLGSESGNALADVLVGNYNPSGKLSMSIPYTVGQIPIYYNQLPTGRSIRRNDVSDWFASKYIDIPNEALYPFGYGLSYSKFEYSNFRLSSNKIRKNEEIIVSVDVKNISNTDGIETVQMYIEAEYFLVSRPMLELKEFRQLEILSGESKTIDFILTEGMLKFVDNNMDKWAADGKYKIFIGSSSKDLLKPIVIDLIKY